MHLSMSLVSILHNSPATSDKYDIQPKKFKDTSCVIKSQLIPSPPLSPSTSTTPIGLTVGPAQSLPSSSANFPIADLQQYKFLVNAWHGLHGDNYKSASSSFLNLYFVSRKPDYARRKDHNRKSHSLRKKRDYNATSSDQSDSGIERVRTRRLVKEKVSSHSSLEKLETTSPKKKRKTKAGSDLVAKPVLVDWESVPDFTPSLETLPANNTKCLKTEWKGQPMNLSNDPLVDKLHPAEVVLASILRLPCNIYLDSKRRLFAEKMARYKKNLPFRRTDSQKACRIDVNKASRLFASFEKIGWLQDHHFVKFL